MKRRGTARTVLILIVAACITLASGACSSARPADAELEQAVRDYTEALVPALAATTLDPLREVATPEQVDRVRLYVVEQTQSSKTRVQARPVSIEFTEAKVDANTATVSTIEEWTYIERDPESQKDVSREDYEGPVTYSLVRNESGTGWLVSDVESRLTP